MMKVTVATVLWIGASSVHAFLESPATSFVQDMYGKASIYHQKKRVEKEDSRNQVVNFLSDIYGLASSTPYHPKRETSSRLLDPPSSHRHVLSAKMMNDPYGVVASTRDHHAGGLLERENEPAKPIKSYVLPRDHGNNVVFDMNAQRQALEAQMQRHSAAEPPVVVVPRPSLVLPTDINGNAVVFDMQQQLNAIQAQFFMPPPPPPPPPQQQQQQAYHAATAHASPQVIVAQAPQTPSVLQDDAPDSLEQLQEHAELMEQQELFGIVDEAAVLH